MIYPRRKSMLSSLMKPFLALIILVGIFGLVRLRSSITTIEYEIGALEGKKVEALKEAQSLRAELASLLSIRQVDDRKMSLVFPDRGRVFYVKRDEGGIPQTASLKDRDIRR